MTVKTALIFAVGAAVLAMVVAWNTMMAAPPGPHAEFSEECEQSLYSVVNWAVREMERQGEGGTLEQRSTITGRIRPACSCVRDKVGAIVADDRWALAGKLTAIKYKAELAARTQNPIVHEHTQAEAREQMQQLLSDDKVPAADIAALSRNIDGTLKACFQQHFNEP